jgi:cob(I)alamin adenosyltransferase
VLLRDALEIKEKIKMKPSETENRLGLIHIYTGEGKGKTSAALGLALRARGAGYSVLLAQLFKSDSSELSQLKKIGVDVIQYSRQHPYLYKGSDKKYSSKELEEIAGECDSFVRNVFELTRKKNYDMLILDEIASALAYGWIDADMLVELVRSKPPMTELIMTGGRFPKKILALAAKDYITEMVKHSHPYDRGILARRGIDC